MSHTILNPEVLHDPVPFGYSHTIRIPSGADLVLISGQYGSAPDGAVTSSDFGEQVRQTFANVLSALAAQGLDPSHVVQLRTYIVNHDVSKLGPVTGAVQEIWAQRPPTQTLIGVASLATPDVLFEVEVVACGPIAF